MKIFLKCFDKMINVIWEKKNNISIEFCIKIYLHSTLSKGFDDQVRIPIYNWDTESGYKFKILNLKVNFSFNSSFKIDPFVNCHQLSTEVENFYGVNFFINAFFLFSCTH